MKTNGIPISPSTVSILTMWKLFLLTQKLTPVRIGELVGHIITVVYTKRGDILRIISDRVARKAERALHGKRSD